MRLQNPLKSSEIHNSALSTCNFYRLLPRPQTRESNITAAFLMGFPGKTLTNQVHTRLYNPQNKSTTLNDCCSSHAEVSQIKCTWGYKILKIRKNKSTTLLCPGAVLTVCFLSLGIVKASQNDAILKGFRVTPVLFDNEGTRVPGLGLQGGRRQDS